jgi:hypothetical protein
MSQDSREDRRVVAKIVFWEKDGTEKVKAMATVFPESLNDLEARLSALCFHDTTGNFEGGVPLTPATHVATHVVPDLGAPKRASYYLAVIDLAVGCLCSHIETLIKRHGLKDDDRSDYVADEGIIEDRMSALRNCLNLDEWPRKPGGSLEDGPSDTWRDD